MKRDVLVSLKGEFDPVMARQKIRDLILDHRFGTGKKRPYMKRGL
jgi:hypothetical protein